MAWSTPPAIKIYEALGAIADGRVEVDGNTAKVYSSSGNKRYEVIYEPQLKAITSNDNGSFWQGYLGYPMVAFLMLKKLISFDSKMAGWLKGIHWKDINTQFKYDFAKTEEFVRQEMQDRGADLTSFDVFKDRVIAEIKLLGLNKLITNARPPEGY